jgi:shikimate kinase/3-dehydroquinate synthase
MPAGLDWFQERFDAETLIRSMARDKKMRDGRLSFVLIRDIGACFTSRDVPMEAVRDLLVSEGCLP